MSALPRHCPPSAGWSLLERTACEAPMEAPRIRLFEAGTAQVMSDTLGFTSMKSSPTFGPRMFARSVPSEWSVLPCLAPMRTSRHATTLSRLCSSVHPSAVGFLEAASFSSAWPGNAASSPGQSVPEPGPLRVNNGEPEALGACMRKCMPLLPSVVTSIDAASCNLSDC